MPEPCHAATSSEIASRSGTSPFRDFHPPDVWKSTLPENPLGEPKKQNPAQQRPPDEDKYYRVKTGPERKPRTARIMDLTQRSLL